MKQTFTRNHFQPRPLQTTVHVAHVRFAAGDSHLKLQLRLQNDRKTFFRPIDEKLDKVRYRLQLLAASSSNQSVNSHSKKQQKRRGGAVSGGGTAATVAVRFLDEAGGEIASKGATIGDALMRTTRIEIGDEIFAVLHNQPLVTGLSVLEPVLVGIPLAPLPLTEFCDADECSWRWLRLDSGVEQYEESKGALCCTTRRYTPSETEVGCRFYVECRAPAMRSEVAEDSQAEVVTTPVLPGPNRQVFGQRKRAGAISAAGKHPDARDALRVMSYNVLFSGYTTTNHAQTKLFPYVDDAVMKETYRMQLVFQEIEETHCDVVCLQEMGEQIFHAFFVPMMTSMGFHAFYSGKTGTTHEGCATFVRISSFEVIEEYALNLATAVKQSRDATAKALLTEFPELAKGIDRIPSIAQVLVLRSRRSPQKTVLLTNTHLFYREDSHLIRLLQTAALVGEVSRRRAERGLEDSAVVMCGDWNAFPGTAAISFLLDGQIDSSHKHWQQAPSFRWDLARNGDSSINQLEQGAKVAPGRITHALHLVSGCGIPPFTNFAGTFVGTLDYILVGSDVLEIREVFPLFSEEDVSEEVALPSSKFPSDHVSLICDLAWRE
ncbi:hypothetical protein BBJ28_00011158 [Nothophytophthora sp. Chile5]|nr:hypothetical protein BBJ28_00011158 [Nothophytophthora sp. Chile5]